MKLKWILSLLFQKQYNPKPNIVQKKLYYNNVEISSAIINFFHSPRKMYKTIRSIQSLINPNVFYARNQKGFNTILFKSNFDVIVADKNGRIIDVFKNCRSNYYSGHYSLGYYVYFFPLGSVDFYKIETNNIMAPGIMILKNLEHIGRL